MRASVQLPNANVYRSLLAECLTWRKLFALYNWQTPYAAASKMANSPPAQVCFCDTVCLQCSAITKSDSSAECSWVHCTLNHQWISAQFCRWISIACDAADRRQADIKRQISAAWRPPWWGGAAWVKRFNERTRILALTIGTGNLVRPADFTQCGHVSSHLQAGLAW